MKKIIKTFLSLVLIVFVSLGFSGCGTNNQVKLAKYLEYNLDSLISTISNTEKINLETDEAFQTIVKNTLGGNSEEKHIANTLQNNVSTQTQAQKTEQVNDNKNESIIEKNKSINSASIEICELCKMLKTYSKDIRKKKVTLSDNQIESTSELLKDLEIHSSRLKMSSSDIQNEFTKIKSYTKKNGNLSSTLNSKIIKLSNTLSLRQTNLSNTLRTLNQIRMVLTGYENVENNVIDNYGTLGTHATRSDTFQMAQNMSISFEPSRKQHETKRSKTTKNQKGLFPDETSETNI